MSDECIKLVNFASFKNGHEYTCISTSHVVLTVYYLERKTNINSNISNDQI